MGVVLGGFIVRLGCCSASRSRSSSSTSIDIAVLLLTIAVIHLALLIWELPPRQPHTRGYPGFKPGRQYEGTSAVPPCSAPLNFPPIDELFGWKDISFEDTLLRDQQDASCSS